MFFWTVKRYNRIKGNRTLWGRSHALFVFIKTKRDLNGSLLLLQNPECILFVIDESVLPHGGELAGQGASVGANVVG